MIEIVRIGARGDGIDEAGGFHHGAVPGDHVAEDGTITPGPARAIPVCAHFGSCGGCQLQHVNDDVYARYVEDRIATALQAQDIYDIDMRQAHLSPPASRRRVALKALKQGHSVKLGFNEASSHKLVDLQACAVMRPELFALVAPLRSLLSQIMGDRKACTVRLTVADQGIDLFVSGIDLAGLAAAEAIQAFAQRHHIARLSIDEGFGPQTLWEPEPVTITLGFVPVTLPEGAFLQATDDGEAALVKAVQDAVGMAKRTADLFAGLGTFAFALPGRVHAAEGSRDAILSLKSAANRAQRPISVEHRDLFRRPLSVGELDAFDAVVLDPPRAGAREQVAELATSKVPVIAYVSCNPATFARDARTLIDGGYALGWVQPVGQFRWSTHVELAARFDR